MGKEVWVKVVDWPYQVSSLGKVRRVSGGKEGEAVKPYGKDTLFVVLQDKPRTPQVARVCELVATNYLGDPPRNHYLRHKNGNRNDNRVSNLDYFPLYLPGEEWRPVNGWPYEVSDLGNIRRKVLDQFTAPLVLTPHSRPHMTVVLTDGPGVRKTHQVHQVVAEAFIGPCPEGLVVNHKDGDPTNNRPSNLEYVTRAENNAHAGRLGLLAHGEQHSNAKLKTRDVLVIRRLYSTGKYSTAQLGKRFGISGGHVSCIVRKLVWSHLD